MEKSSIEFSLAFEGFLADENLINMYDAAKAVSGFQRTLALTTHLILNGEIITQAPSLSGAEILLPAFEEGSWKTKALIVFGSAAGAFGVVGGASTDSLVGHLISSGYAYVTNEAFGFEADYESTLQEQVREYNDKTDKKLDVSRFDALVEKCENSIIDMHRPISISKSAEVAKIDSKCRGHEAPNYPLLTLESYEYASFTDRSDIPKTLIAKITSYNINTHKGRAFLPDLGNRTIPFSLSEIGSTFSNAIKITNGLAQNAQNLNDEAFVYLTFFTNDSQSGRVKSLYVVNVLTPAQYEAQQKTLNLEN